MKYTDEVLNEVCEMLPTEWNIRKEGTSTQSFNILDSYGGVLLSSGMALLEFSGKTAKIELLPEELEERIVNPGSGKKFDPDSLADTRLKRIVRSRIGEWRLTTCAKGTEITERYRLENKDRKGVARILIRTFKCAGGSPIKCIEVRPYRGYGPEVSSFRSSVEALYPLSAVLPEFLRSLPDTARGLAD